MCFRSALVSSFLFVSAALAARILPRGFDLNNLAGAILSSGPNSYQSITADFIVPSVQPVPGSEARMWIGLDGITCGEAGIRGGVTVSVDGNGQTSYSLFTERDPGITVPLTLPVAPGDDILVTINVASDGTSGSVEFMNLGTSATASQNFPANVGSTLCMQDLVWVVEAPPNTVLVPFGEVRFEDAEGNGPAGVHTPADGASASNIQQGGTTLTTTTLSVATVDITYQ